MGLPRGAWVVVADAEKALFFENVGEEDHPHLQIRRKEEHENPPTREQGTDRPGRFNDPGPGQKGAYAETDWHRLEKDRFAQDLAAELYARAHRGRFDRLVIVASHDVLGKLRQELHKEVADRVIATIAKTLTHEPVDALERRLAAGIGDATPR